jgi:hypothetical protein
MARQWTPQGKRYYGTHPRLQVFASRHKLERMVTPEKFKEDEHEPGAETHCTQAAKGSRR